MADKQSDVYPPQLSQKKRISFALALILASLFISITAGELILNFKRKYIRKSDRLDHGMMQYDRHLGWRLTPNWKGRHKHYDFDVGYTTNTYGFRGDFAAASRRGGLKYAFVGDSFTFSFGVNDDETFVQLLNSQKTPQNTYFNFGVPGYSTDQEYLLVKQRVLFFDPDVILLVVYLGNDLFDNQLPYPLQANRAKPYFEIAPHGLQLRNVPVPPATKPPELTQKNLMTVVFGENPQSTGSIADRLDRFELVRLLKNDHSKDAESIKFDDRFEHALRLFSAIVDQLRQVCLEKGSALTLVLMPGRSYVQRPGSPSAQFQDYLRSRIVDGSQMKNIPTIDLASHLRRRYQKSPGRWYHPHEGHLTPQGHRVVADILASALN